MRALAIALRMTWRFIMNVKRIAYTFSMGAGTALLGATVALAQSPGGSPQQQPSMPQSQNPSSGQEPGSNSNPGQNAGAPTSAQDFSERAFITKAMEGGMAEVQLGQLAQQKSQSNDVKQFAAKMVNDHGQMGDKWLKPVAQQMGINAPSGPSKKDKKEIEKLQGLSGQDFDKEYITMMVKDHQKDLKEFQSEAQAAQDPTIKQIADKGSQVIQQHLQIIERIAKAHNVDVGGKEMSSTK
jgi:putative membrane protein